MDEKEEFASAIVLAIIILFLIFIFISNIIIFFSYEKTEGAIVNSGADCDPILVTCSTQIKVSFIENITVTEEELIRTEGIIGFDLVTNEYTQESIGTLRLPFYVHYFLKDKERVKILYKKRHEYPNNNYADIKVSKPHIVYNSILYLFLIPFLEILILLFALISKKIKKSTVLVIIVFYYLVDLFYGISAS